MILKIYIIRKSLQEISEQIRDKIDTDTNTIIDIPSSDKGIRKLSSELNIQLKRLQEERIRCQQGDIGLKKAVTNISHDLRTPLTAVCGYLELIQRENLSPDIKRYIEIISGRTDTMKQLTEELLRYSVAVSDDNSLLLEDIVINNVLEESISAFYALLTENNITPEINICEEKIHRILNRNALNRIFSNIISNAVKYSDGDLSISLFPDGRIIFSNHSCMLDEISAGKLFDRFYTVESAGKSTGLGLSISKALAERMNGRIYSEYSGTLLSITVFF